MRHHPADEGFLTIAAFEDAEKPSLGIFVCEFTGIQSESVVEVCWDSDALATEADTLVFGRAEARTRVMKSQRFVEDAC